MGIRTEEITLAGERSSLPKEWVYPALVKVVEPLGNENHLHVAVQGETFVGRCEGRRIVKAGESLDISFNLDLLHLFDAKTSLVVYQGK